MPFIARAARPLDFGKTTLIGVDFTDYLWALDGGGLMSVAIATGRGCGQAEAITELLLQQLRSRALKSKKPRVRC